MLGIDVSADLLALWATWLAPDPHPFLVGPDNPWVADDIERGVLAQELQDTFRLWSIPRDSRLIWLSDERFHSLPRTARAALVREQVARRRRPVVGRPDFRVGAVPTVRAWADLLDARILRNEADGHRFLWWPSLVAVDPAAILGRMVAADRLASRHTEVAESTWRTCEGVLPGARGLAGTFATGSTANCFSTVLTAAGAEGADVYDSVEPFTRWLATRCRPGGDSTRPGTVMVWRDAEGEPVHSAVAIGDGWVLEKPSGEWHSPRAIVAAADVVRLTRLAGQRLERHTING